jgi:thiamine-monophosphate kinase
MDVSDGLVSDVEKLCAASKVSASIDIDAVPVHPCLVEAFPNSWRELALTGGEDYELVFTADQSTMRAVANELGDLVTVIGSIQPGDGRVKVEDASGRTVGIESTGWDHFAG